MISKEPCPKCRKKGEDTTGDNLVVFDDGHKHCFACNYQEQLNDRGSYDVLELGYTYQYVPHRGITEGTMRHYDVQTKVDAEGSPKEVLFNWGSQGQIRDFREKKFRAVGDSEALQLFGQDKFTQGQSKVVTITEGAYDAMATYQMLGGTSPVVAVRSAASARKDCEKARDWLNSFDKIVLVFDSDKPGIEATRETALLFDVNKIHVVTLTHKDPNDYLMKGEVDEFRQSWNNAKAWLPKNIIATYSDIEQALSKDDAPSIGTYPFARLNEMLYGIRSAELVLFLAQEKVGKTEVLRAIEHHLLKTTDHNMAVIHLEEQEKRSIQGLAGYELKAPVHLPDSGYSNSDILSAYKKLTKRDGRCHFYTHFGSDDPDLILDTIRYLVTVRHCKFLFLDHITMLVTGFEGDDERKKLDYMSTRLAMMTRNLDFTLFLVSHVNDDGKARGSRNIAKVADHILFLERDTEAASIDERNRTTLTVRGNRFAGVTGPGGYLYFDPKTFTLKELTEEDVQSQISGGSIRNSAEGGGKSLYPEGF